MRAWYAVLIFCACSKASVPDCEAGYGRDAAGECVRLAADSDAAVAGTGEAGDCADGADNDRDGLFDCHDPDCFEDEACPGETGRCTDGADNDRDGFFDCDDPDCAGDPACKATAADPDADAGSDMDGTTDAGSDVDVGTDADADAGTVPDSGADTDGSGDVDGSADVDAGIDSGDSLERYHPDGYAGARVHGPDTNDLVEDCMPCHGDDLRGMTGPFPETTENCDDCHRGHEEWRSNCTYCHGGEETEDGAPPREVNGEEDASPSTYSFQAHTAHVTDSAMKVGFACTECHAQPEDIFTLGHVLLGDTTPGRSEVTFEHGINPSGSWSSPALGVGTCSDLYCHSNGQEDDGEVQEDAAERSCSDCHVYLDDGSSGWSQMSGEHREHLREPGANCTWCHAATMSDADCTDGASCITDITKHLNRENDVVFQPDLVTTMEWTASSQTCSSDTACHGSRDWVRPDLDEDLGPPPDEDLGPPPDEDFGPPPDEDMGPPVDEDMGPPLGEDMGPPLDEDVGPPPDEDLGPPLDEGK